MPISDKMAHLTTLVKGLAIELGFNIDIKIKEYGLLKITNV
jgi:hypothetical protein